MTTKILPLMMRQKSYGVFLLVTAVIGFLASGALVLERLALYKDPDHIASCDFGLFVSCSSLMKTTQASLFGFPNPFLGIMGFPVLITLAVLLISGVTMPRWIMRGLQIGLTLALILVGFFWYTSVYAVMTLCPWCMVVWAMVIPAFILTTSYNIYHGNLTKYPSAKMKEFVNGWWWVLVIVVFVGIVGSILIRFAEYIF
ncbi:MAG: vitamin K epoxide reductase family protein [Enterococcus sp.]|nr:vitamin K epoxide reductase family protein [Enterococcus sp.]